MSSSIARELSWEKDLKALARAHVMVLLICICEGVIDSRFVCICEEIIGFGFICIGEGVSHLGYVWRTFVLFLHTSSP